jgi:hypothetical protein
MSFDYRDAPIEPRPDLAEAHRAAWRHVASPGTWWTGRERVLIAAETRLARDCALCADRKAALSPYGIEGDHASAGELPRAAIEAAHRLTTDPGRLKREWVEELTGEGATDAQGRITMEQYVELIGVVTQVVSVDWFHIAMGLELEDLPNPEAGEPTRVRPPGARPEQAWVPMIQPANLDPANEDLYGPKKRTGNVIRAMSLVPEEVRQLQALSGAQYLSLDQMMQLGTNFRAISRAQIELVAGRISALNECFY